MKKRLMYLFLITACLITGSFRNQNNGNQNNGADKQEVSESNPYDGLYDWYVNYQDMTGQMYREELGCEVKNGRVVDATWYSHPKSSPLTGSLNGNILELSGNNSIYKSLWIKFTIDLRNGRGTVSNNLIPSTEAKFYNNN